MIFCIVIRRMPYNLSLSWEQFQKNNCRLLNLVTTEKYSALDSQDKNIGTDQTFNLFLKWSNSKLTYHTFKIDLTFARFFIEFNFNPILNTINNSVNYNI